MEKEIDEKIWDLYLQDFLVARFSGNAMMSFDDYKKPPANKQDGNKTDDEIMDESLNILKSISKPQ